MGFVRGRKDTRLESIVGNKENSEMARLETLGWFRCIFLRALVVPEAQADMSSDCPIVEHEGMSLKG